MGRCCIDSCKNSSLTHRLYKLPKSDELRALWLSCILPYNKSLGELSRPRLLRKYVCQVHFDKYQYSKVGYLRYKESFPCLFTAKEIEHGIPLPNTVQDHLSDHNYYIADHLMKEDPLGLEDAESISDNENNYESVDKVQTTTVENFEQKPTEKSQKPSLAHMIETGKAIVKPLKTLSSIIGKRKLIVKPLKTTLSRMVDTGLQARIGSRKTDKNLSEDGNTPPIYLVDGSSVRRIKGKTKLLVRLADNLHLKTTHPRLKRIKRVKRKPVARPLPWRHSVEKILLEAKETVDASLRYKINFEEEEPLSSDIFDEKTPVENEKDAPFGLCRCCLKEDSHITGDIYELLGCLNMEVRLDPRVSRVFCAECYSFLVRARQFRDAAVAAQEALAAARQAALLGVNRPLGTLRDNKKSELFLTGRIKVNLKKGKLKTYSRKDAAALKRAKRAKIKLCTDFENTETGYLDVPDQQRNDNCSEDSEEDNYVREYINIKPLREVFKEEREQEAKLESQIKENLFTILQYTTIVPFANTSHTSFQCIYCNYSFDHIDILRYHLKTHNDDNVKKTAICLIPELVLRADVSCIRCKICHEIFDTIDDIIEHLIKLHNTKYHNLTLSPPHNILPFDLTKGFRCIECGETFTKFKALLGHVNLHYGSHLCQYCGAKYVYFSSYQQHVYDEIKKRAESFPVTSEVVQCSICMRYFLSHSRLQAHLKLAHRPGIKSTRDRKLCPYCPNAFGTIMNLKKHISEVHGKDKAMELRNTSAYAYTYARYSGRRPCTFCSETFTKKVYLARHMNREHKKEIEERAKNVFKLYTGVSGVTHLVAMPLNTTNVIDMPADGANVIELPLNEANSIGSPLNGVSLIEATLNRATIIETLNEGNFITTPLNGADLLEMPLDDGNYIRGNDMPDITFGNAIVE